jgi:hypothetical protein
MSMQELVALAVAQRGLGNDALLAAVLPLFHATAQVHERGLVAPLRGLDRITLDERIRLGFAPEHAGRPVLSPRELAAREGRRGAAVDVVARHQVDTDLGGGGGRPELRVVEPVPDAVTAPVLVPGWQSWEHVIGHHDPLTDIFSLGQLLIGLGCGLDLSRPEDLSRLVAARGNLYALGSGLHPVVASVAGRMAEPDRHRRAQDLHSVIEQLENYRDQPLDFDVAAVTRGAADRRTAVLQALRDRLFDLSRRNRLINFRHTAQTLNLTEVSVPLMLDLRNIRAEHLFTWNPALAGRLLGGRPQSLGRWIRYDEAPYAASTLDKLISTARRDRAEYGQDQLRLVPAFLRWHDLKNDPATRLVSPLVLVAVEVTKKRGVRDSYTLQVTDPVAEINPALRQHLHQLYGITLPEKLDLTEPDAIGVLHQRLAAEIRASEPGLDLHLRERPRIELVRNRAMVRLRSYRRRRHGNTRNEFGGRHYSYSYRRSDYQPLGVQIFRTQLAEAELPLGVVLGAEPSTRRPAATETLKTGTPPSGSPQTGMPETGTPQTGTPRTGTLETDTYSLETGDAGSPYSWDVDLCAVALANFSYRTLGLVRDYDELLDTGRSAPPFEELFSDRPRPISPDPAELPTGDRHLVVPADGSQVAAVARARRGESLVIQGPPGTGKSQTITNLIADFVARGRRVLFVCQKRAALDVVHARLAGRRLDELCTLIHDSQADKKSFVHGLRETYETWLAAADDLDDLTVRRDAVVARVDRLLATVGRFEALLAATETSAGAAVPPPGRAQSHGPLGSEPSVGGEPSDGRDGRPRPVGDTAPTLRTVVDRLADLRDHRWGDDLPPPAKRLIPSPADWWRSRAIVRAVSSALAGADPASEGLLARSPLGAVAAEVWSSPGADTEIPVRAAAVGEDLAAVAEALQACSAAAGLPEPPGGWDDQPLDRLRALGELGTVLRPLAERGLGSVLDPGSTAGRRLRAAVARQDSLAAAERAAWSAAAGWREPLSPADARTALTVAQSKEGRLLSFLNGDWRSVRALVGTRFDASGRAVRPSVTEALTTLVAAHDAGAARQEELERSEHEWGTADPGELTGRLAGFGQDRSLAAWCAALTAEQSAGTAQALARLHAAIERADDRCRGFLTEEPPGRTLADVRELAAALASARLVPALQALVPALRELGTAPAPVQAAVRALPAAPDQLEYAVCALRWSRARAAAPLLTDLTSARLDTVVGELSLAYDELTALNAGIVVAGVRRRFLTELAHSERSLTGMSADDRARKKAFSAGRRELEHEFGKVMRYRSIRDLASGTPGSVVSVLRPVWLMSPASVSDTLPLDTTFDVVIYDEASQIPVEEAIPALHRAPQIIVVGDQMQLPPTQYFRVAGPAADPDTEDAEQVGIALTDDSFLAISALRLSSTMLSWHYRSRSEALISFSNAAFYQGRLATVPDRLPARPAPPWTVRADAPVTAEVVDGVLAGSITSVRVADGVYVRRTNPAEAGWIARLVRELLGRGTGPRAGHSIGIVAFSEAQQDEIERALDDLARADAEFAARYEAEQVRSRDEQDAGLFVKNLENVQGDERDIVIMSVCYAAGPDGRMLMNFGPINTAGGEKRLNVIFSRAREHMVIVSSIEPDAITNTYNDGANTLRRFLVYADAVSRGDTRAARAALATYATAGRSAAGARAPTAAGGAGTSGAVIEQLAEALRARGVEVSTAVGESVFRCDLALRRPGDEGHRLAVLVDTPERIAADSLLERLSTHPRALAAGGWRVHHVLTGDWDRDPDAVVARLLDSLDRPVDSPGRA